MENLITMLKPTHITLIGAIITGIGALITGYGTYLQNTKSSEKSDTILNTSKNTNEKVENLKNQNSELQLKADDLSQKSEVQSQTIEKLRTDLDQRTNQLADLSKRLADKSDELNEVIIGKNRFIEIAFFVVPNSETIQFAVKNTFPTFIEDVQIVMRDYNKMTPFIIMVNNKPTISPKALDDATVHFEKISSVAANDMAIFKTMLIDPNAVYTFVIGSRGKIVYEKMVFYQEGAKIYVGYFVTETDGRVIKEEFFGAPDIVKQIITKKINSVYDNIQFSN
jgi:hypothetical protein